jgi:tRNA(adenine34) deaminase
MQFRAQDVAALRRALVEAHAAAVAGEVPIGAVVIDASGTVIGVGRNEREATQDPTAHAEVVALRDAARRTGNYRLTGATL